MTGTMHVARNITDQKRAEDEIRQHLGELCAGNAELERFNSASTGRELRMIELKMKGGVMSQYPNSQRNPK